MFSILGRSRCVAPHYDPWVRASNVYLAIPRLFFASFRLRARILKIAVAFKVACRSKTRKNKRVLLKLRPLDYMQESGITIWNKKRFIQETGLPKCHFVILCTTVNLGRKSVVESPSLVDLAWASMLPSARMSRGNFATVAGWGVKRWNRAWKSLLQLEQEKIKVEVGFWPRDIDGFNKNNFFVRVHGQRIWPSIGLHNDRYDRWTAYKLLTRTKKGLR